MPFLSLVSFSFTDSPEIEKVRREARKKSVYRLIIMQDQRISVGSKFREAEETVKISMTFSTYLPP